MKNVNIEDVENYVLGKKKIEINTDQREKVQKTFNFLKDFSADKIIYGINTGFGPMAQFNIEGSKLKELQYNLVRSHSSGSGKALEEEYARSVMYARLQNFLQAKSGISEDVVIKLTEFLNHNVIPEIFEHGGVGASGDLVQLSHLALSLIGEGYVCFNNKRTRTNEVLEVLGIKPLELKLRDGLGLINGTSCMTGIGALNLIYSYRLLDWAIVSSAIVNEIVEAFDDSFSTGLNGAKKHNGQQEIASEMRAFLADSELISQREELFKDNKEIKRVEFKKKIQEYYSVRCVPQILGPVKDTLDYAKEVIENELNSTNDNPVVDLEEENVFHGGNFHGDYVSLEMDKVKLVITKLTMLMERQSNFLMNPKLNKKFQPFLNLGVLGLNFGVQGMQFTSTSTTAENQMLSNSMYVHSIPNNNDNQDIVSMGTNSALITQKVIENAFQVMSIQIISLCQAIDLLSKEEFEKLGSKTKLVHSNIRELVSKIEADVPQNENIEKVRLYLKSIKRI